MCLQHSTNINKIDLYTHTHVCKCYQPTTKLVKDENLLAYSYILNRLEEFTVSATDVYRIMDPKLIRIHTAKTLMCVQS
jgi:hypothetical protein